jgi:hypothetical protein
MRMRWWLIWMVVVDASCGGDDADPTPETPADAAVGSPRVDAGIDAGTDAGTVDAQPTADATPHVTLAGQVANLGAAPVVGATLSFVEAPSLTTTTDGSGHFTLQVPAETPLTLLVQAAGQVDTMEQTAIFHQDTTGQTVLMANPSQYAYLAGFGSTPAGSGIFFVQVYPGACTITGAHLGTTPSSGTMVYAMSNELPNGSYTSIQPNAPGGYLIGASGDVTPWIQDVPAPCAMRPFPVDLGTLSVLGPIHIRAGAFHDVSLFVQ